VGGSVRALSGDVIELDLPTSRGPTEIELPATNGRHIDNARANLARARAGRLRLVNPGRCRAERMAVDNELRVLTGGSNDPEDLIRRIFRTAGPPRIAEQESRDECRMPDDVAQPGGIVVASGVVEPCGDATPHNGGDAAAVSADCRSSGCLGCRRGCRPSGRRPGARDEQHRGDGGEGGPQATVTSQTSVRFRGQPRGDGRCTASSPQCGCAARRRPVARGVAG